MRIYGHRGARGEAPENTLAGFLHASRHGIRHFELDIVLAADGQPVVIHDLTVDRTTAGSGRVGSFTAPELGQMDARRNTAPWHRPAPIPTLEAVFESCPDFVHMQLEVKKDQRQRLNILCNRLVEIIHQHRWQQRLTITSTDAWFLQEVKRRDRHISTGLVCDKRYPNPARMAHNLGCEYLCCKWTLCSRELVEAAHRDNLHVSAWTVNRIQDMLELEKKGVDSIITDFPTSTRIYFDNRLKDGSSPAAHAGAVRQES